jgi:hypothetical protein
MLPNFISEIPTILNKKKKKEGREKVRNAKQKMFHKFPIE